MDTPILTATISAATALLVTALGSYFARRAAKHDRVRNEVLRSGTPLMESIRDLRHRLDSILNREGYRALSRHSRLDANWSMTFEYQMTSTLFLFAQYFAWVRRLREGASLELFGSGKKRQAMLTSIFEATRPLSTWPPRDPLPAGGGRDGQVFALQQRALGEALLIEGGGERRFMTYHEFQSQQGQLESRLVPLRNLLEDLAKTDDCRWHRLALTHRNLAELEDKFGGTLERNLRSSKAAEHAVADNSAAGTSV